MQPDLSQYKTLLLDMDGTLLDLAFDNHFWLNTLPEELAMTHGIPAEQARQRVYGLIEAERGTLNWYCLDFWSRALELDVLALKRTCPEPIRFIDGAEGFLRRARAAGFQLLLVTNSSPGLLDLKNEATGVVKFVDAAYSSAQFDAPKESAEFWHRFFERTGEIPQQCVLIDDSHAVLAAAHDFGVGGVVGIRHPDTGREPNALAGWPAVDYIRELLV